MKKLLFLCLLLSRIAQAQVELPPPTTPPTTNASSLTVGTVDDARLSPNVTQNNAAQSLSNKSITNSNWVGGTITGASVSGTFSGTITGRLSLTGTVSATSGLAAGVAQSTTLTATANNDVLVGFDFNPTFTNGAFTGVTNYATRISNNVMGYTYPLAVFNTVGSGAQILLGKSTVRSISFGWDDVSGVGTFDTYNSSFPLLIRSSLLSIASPLNFSGANPAIKFGGTNFAHNFGTNNTFLGLGSGNTTLTGTGNTVVGAGSGTGITTGSNNIYIGVGVNGTTESNVFRIPSTVRMMLGGATDNGSSGLINTNDIEVSVATKGFILKSPNGTRYRVTVSDAGVLTTTAL